MPLRIFTGVPDLKIVGAGVVAAASTIADAAGQMQADTWESVGVKGMLLIAIGFLVRELGKQREAEKERQKSEMAAAVERQKIEMEAAIKREDELKALITANTTAKEDNTRTLQELKAGVELQTSFFKTVAQTILAREVHPKLPD